MFLFRIPTAVATKVLYKGIFYISILLNLWNIWAVSIFTYVCMYNVRIYTKCVNVHMFIYVYLYINRYLIWIYTFLRLVNMQFSLCWSESRSLELSLICYTCEHSVPYISIFYTYIWRGTPGDEADVPATK